MTYTNTFPLSKNGTKSASLKVIIKDINQNLMPNNFKSEKLIVSFDSSYGDDIFFLQSIRDLF